MKRVFTLILVLLMQSASARQAGEYDEARRKAQWSLWLNTTAAYFVSLSHDVGNCNNCR